MVSGEVEPVHFPSVLEIPCDVTNGQHLDTRIELGVEFKIDLDEPGLKEL